jgi:hypothetical protein
VANSFFDFFFLVTTHDVILREAIQFSLGHNSARGRVGPSAPSHPKCPNDDRRLSRHCLAGWKQGFGKATMMPRGGICSFPAGLKVDSTFDIFKRLPDANFTCIAAVRGLGEATRRVNRGAKQNEGHYLIHSQALMF